jgi:hypothetical protein
MPERMLLIGSDAAWLQATQLALEDKGIQTVACRDDTAALCALTDESANALSAAIILGYHVGSVQTAAMASEGYGARDLAIELRAKRRNLPILFVAPQRIDLLQRYANGTDGVKIIERESSDAIRDALGGGPAPSGAKQPWAQVDISIEVEAVKVQVLLANGEKLIDQPVPSDLRPFLEDWQNEFAPWKLYKYDSSGPRLNDGWPARLFLVGDRLHQYLANDPQRTAIETCLQRVHDMDDIHFRFVTNHSTFPDVPFEAMRDRSRAMFIRERSPLARRIALGPSESNVSAAAAVGAKLTGRVLLIKSDAGTGTLRVGHHRFNGQENRSFRRLPNLDTELASVGEIRDDHGCEPPEICALQTGGDNVALVTDKLRQGPWDIVHYCGHSVRTDDDEVYLVLPGDAAGKLVGMSMADFALAARQGGVSLVILSSCEGASPRGVFRLAQEGVPAAIGFRWEVMSGDAAKFSACLHEKLAGSMPLGRAYHEAVHKLTSDSPAFLSAMLVVQQDGWAYPKLATGALSDVRPALAGDSHHP